MAQHSVPRAKPAEVLPGAMCIGPLAVSRGFRVTELICRLGPDDPVHEKEMPAFKVAAVLEGSFGYRSSHGEGVVVPGSLLTGNACDCYSCTHITAHGDRCVEFQFEAWFLERVRVAFGAKGLGERFRRAVLPPSTQSVAITAIADALAAGHDDCALEEAALEIAAAALAATHATADKGRKPTFNDERRIVRATHYIAACFDRPCTLDALAAEAGLSSYHFLRVFRRVTGQTPHRYVLATRLRRAAQRLMTTPDKIVDVAADVGFGDLSNFNASFARAFGLRPGAFRLRHSRVRPCGRVEAAGTS